MKDEGPCDMGGEVQWCPTRVLLGSFWDLMAILLGNACQTFIGILWDSYWEWHTHMRDEP